MGCKELIGHEKAYRHSDWFLSLQGMVMLQRNDPKGPWVTKGELTKIASGVAEPMRVSATKKMVPLDGQQSARGVRVESKEEIVM
jgi:hypothetical protein